MWRVYVLGFACYYEAAAHRLTYFGPRHGAAWPRVCRLNRLIGAHLVVVDHAGLWARHGKAHIRQLPGLTEVAL